MSAGRKIRMGGGSWSNEAYTNSVVTRQSTRGASTERTHMGSRNYVEESETTTPATETTAMTPAPVEEPATTPTEQVASADVPAGE